MECSYNLIKSPRLDKCDVHGGMWPSVAGCERLMMECGHEVGKCRAVVASCHGARCKGGAVIAVVSPSQSCVSINA